VITRTAALTPVQHTSFAIRFSDLTEIEDGCREPEEQRAGRFIDWIGARIALRSSSWVEHWESSGAAKKERSGDTSIRTPWWAELQSCVEGERIPSRVEGWNHPIALIFAVSTFAANPLQALAQLHIHPPELPQWVDSSHLRYTLIVHPKGSPLSDEEYIPHPFPLCLRTYHVLLIEQRHFSTLQRSSMAYTPSSWSLTCPGSSYQYRYRIPPSYLNSPRHLSMGRRAIQLDTQTPALYLLLQL